MIDRETAVAIARSRAADKGWGFAEPALVVHRRDWFGKGGRYEISTDPAKRGAKARFVIDALTGEILSEGYIAR